MPHGDWCVRDIGSREAASGSVSWRLWPVAIVWLVMVSWTGAASATGRSSVSGGSPQAATRTAAIEPDAGALAATIEPDAALAEDGDGMGSSLF
jgi:hypothetical protein